MACYTAPNLAVKAAGRRLEACQQLGDEADQAQFGGSRLTVRVDADDADRRREDEELERFVDKCGHFEFALAEKAMTIEHFDL